MSGYCLAKVWESIWNWAGRVPLRAKIIGIVLAATCLTGSGVLLWTESRLSRPIPESSAVALPFELSELLAIVLIAMAVGLLVAWLLTNILTHQITQLTRVARKVERGDLSQRAPVWANDEIGQLAATFNAMIDSLTASQATLEATNTHLTERNQTLSALYSLAALSAKSINTDRILSDGLDKALQIAGADAGAILVLEQGHEFSVHAECAIPACLRDNPRLFSLIDQTLFQAIETGQPAQTTFRCPDCGDLSLAARPGSADCDSLTVHATPMQARNSANGALVLMRRGGEKLLAEKSESFLRAISSLLGVAVENARLWNELKQRDTMRARLLANAVNAQEQERERISRELHDETGQALTALLVQLKVLERLRDEQAILAHAETLRQLVLGMLEEVRRLARDLRPGMLDELGLVPTLEWHTRNFAQNADLAVDFAANVSEGFRLPVHTELALYRVAQEALTNIVRHANATAARVQLEESNGALHLTITDNGCGFDVASVMNTQERGVGLLGIQERVELVGGTLSVVSAPGTGTSVSVDVPLLERTVAI